MKQQLAHKKLGTRYKLDIGNRGIFMDDFNSKATKVRRFNRRWGKHSYLWR